MENRLSAFSSFVCSSWECFCAALFKFKHSSFMPGDTLVLVQACPPLCAPSLTGRSIKKWQLSCSAKPKRLSCRSAAPLPPHQPCMLCTYGKHVCRHRVSISLPQASRLLPPPPRRTTNSFSRLHLLYIIRDISSHSEPITAHGGVNLIQSKPTLNISLRFPITDTSILRIQNENNFYKLCMLYI